MPAESLASLFSVLHDNLVLVVFNACSASTQASALRRSAKVAIGMRSRTEDGAAIAFASALYGALAYGRSAQEAFTLGVAALLACDQDAQRESTSSSTSSTAANHADVFRRAAPPTAAMTASQVCVDAVRARAAMATLDEDVFLPRSPIP